MSQKSATYEKESSFRVREWGSLEEDFVAKLRNDDSAEHVEFEVFLELQQAKEMIKCLRLDLDKKNEECDLLRQVNISLQKTLLQDLPDMIASVKKIAESTRSPVKEISVQDSMVCNSENPSTSEPLCILERIDSEADLKQEDSRFMIMDGDNFEQTAELASPISTGQSPAGKLVIDLLTTVFSRKELATSSITGRVCNAHKNNGITEPKKKLDPVKLNAIVDYVKKKYPEVDKKQILRHIRNKCKNESSKQFGARYRKIHTPIADFPEHDSDSFSP